MDMVWYGYVMYAYVQQYRCVTPKLWQFREKWYEREIFFGGTSISWTNFGLLWRSVPIVCVSQHYFLHISISHNSRSSIYILYYISYIILYDILYMIYYIWYIIYDILYFVYDILYIILYSIYHGSLKEVQISWFKRWNLVRVCVISHGLAVDRKNTAEGHFKDLCTALDAGHWCELNNGLLGDFVHFVFEFQFQ